MDFTTAARAYEELGVDVETAMEVASRKALSVHCWQGDDLVGYDSPQGGTGNGILATGDYPGRARTFAELTSDFEFAMRFVPGAKRIALHASYAIFDDAHPWVDRDRIGYEHFEPWVAWARERGYGIDFNPTVFSHPMMRDGLSLSSPDAEVRRFWIDHCLRCREISQRIGEELDDLVQCNLWIPDGLKDVPADRFGPRRRLRDSLDEVYAEPLDRVVDSVESKWFGIGVEAYTVGSPEFYLAYAMGRPHVHVLMDTGHYHPGEPVSEKLPTLELFEDWVPLHVSRPMNWDSDHVVTFDDELRELCKEIVRNGCVDRVLIGSDYFDASINRVAAWVVGSRSLQKALLWALLQPNEALRELQDAGNFTKKLALMEEAKTLPFADVWAEYCARQGVPAGFGWFAEVERYEREVLSKRS